MQLNLIDTDSFVIQAHALWSKKWLILVAAFKKNYITLNSFLIPSITFIAALVGIIPLLFKTGSVFESLVMKKEGT